jgi:lipoate-protein ligase A
MRLLDLTLPTPAENLALDEALLDAAEQGPAAQDTARGEVLRLWEPSRHFVVVGRSSQIDREVNRAACRHRGVPILRRASGGAAIVAGPGCLMYGVVQSYERRPELRMLDQAHAFVLARVVSALGALGLSANHSGTSDVTIDNRKISGNSLRCKRDYFLYHGTLLYDFDLPLVGELLRQPPRQPEYRAARSHNDFVTNVPVNRDALRQALIAAWQAREPLLDWPRDLTARLVAERYGSAAWNESR